MEDTASLFDRIEAVAGHFRIEHGSAAKGDKPAKARACRYAAELGKLLRQYRKAIVAETKPTTP